jgi:hypothetical protein
MNRSKRRLLIVLVFPAALAAGFLAPCLEDDPTVTMTVLNSSQKPIAAVRLDPERGVEVVENIAPIESKTIRFVAAGETFYKLRVRFRDGSEVSGRPQYAESGHYFTDTVRDSGIESDVRLPTPYWASHNRLEPAATTRLRR